MNWKNEAKRSEKIYAKKLSKKKQKNVSETKQKINFQVSRNKAKRKQNGFCFASFRFEAKKCKKRKWDTLNWPLPSQGSQACGLGHLLQYLREYNAESPKQGRKRFCYVP